MLSTSSHIIPDNLLKPTIVNDTEIVTEIPETMKTLVTWIVRAFYSVEHYVVLEIIKRAECIQEEALKERTKFEARQLRQIIKHLSDDKLIKERQCQEQRTDGRSMRVNYYYVNYRAIVNVAKYKLDHMRAKLESRENDNTKRALYKCKKCASPYTALDVQSLFDMSSNMLKCWRCSGEVDEDQEARPTDQSRSQLAKFNEQMSALFSLLISLEGVQLAPNLLEPNIQNAVKESSRQPNDIILQEAAAVQKSGNRGLPALGARATGAPMYTDLYRQEVTVHLEGEQGASAAKISEPEQPAWMSATTLTKHVQQHYQPSVLTEEARAAASLTADSHWAQPKTELPEPKEEPTDVKIVPDKKVLDLLRHEISEPQNELFVKQEPKEEEKSEDSSTSSEDDDDDDPILTVAGAEYRLSAIQEDSSLIDKMTAEEKAKYVDAQKQTMDDHFF